MTHQQNKQFNSYKEGLDLEFLREYCMEHGERRVMERGETLEEAGEPAQWVAYVERGSFKYMVHRSATKETLGSSKNDEEGKDYCTGFAFEGEFVSDFPYCLDGDVSEVSIEADMPCEVRVISGQELQALFDNDPKMAKMDVKILKRSNLFACYQRDARTCSRWSIAATSTTTATPPAAATADCSNAVRRWCRCSRSRTSPRSSMSRPPT